MTPGRCLAQVAPRAKILTELYRCPAKTATALHSITVANQGTETDHVTFSVALGGAAFEAKQSIFFSLPVEPGVPFVISEEVNGIALNAGDLVRFWCETAFLSVNLFGRETEA